MASLDERLRMRAAWETVRLAETITHAFENTEFYRELWTEQGVSPSLFVDRSSLELFPSIRKSDFSARPRRLISKVDPPDTIRDTSGTTGVRLPVYMNAEEERALAELRRGRSEGHPRPKVTLRILPPPRRLRPVTRQELDNATGSLVMHILPGYDPNVWYDAVDMLISVLCEEYFVGPELATIDLIHTTPPPLFEYASRLMDERGIEPSRFNVKEILLTGGPLVASSRAYLAKLWNAAVVATYSCTEVRSEAMECAANPRVYHPSPSMVAEVLDRRTGRHVGHGEAGEVALTGLFPFQRVMPMVRYRPGDFARFFSAPCTCGSSTVGIEPLGRTQDLLDLTELPHHPRVIGTTGVFEALGPIPQVPKFPYPRAEFAKTTVDGKTSVELRIEATDPRSFAAKPVEDRILELLLDADPDLRLLKETAEIALSVKLVPKNSLSHFFRIYPGR